MAFEEFIGQQQAIAALSDLLSQSQPTATLLVGPAGSGRSVAAAAALNAWRSPQELLIDLSARQLVMNDRAGRDEDDPQFSFSQLRKLLSLRAVGRRGVLITLDAANAQVQNVLLKTFEEPPRDTWLIALSSNPSAVLATLRSRCHRVSFHPLTPQDLAALANRDGLTVAEGTIGRAGGSYETLRWLAANPAADEAVARDDAAAVIAAALGCEDRRQATEHLLRVWPIAHPGRLAGCHEGIQALAKAARPETCLALAALS